MSKLRTLSGKEVIDIFVSLGFAVVNQKGSHVKLRRETDEMRQTLIVPNHSELDKGTIRAIYQQACHYLPQETLKPLFYTA